MRVFTRRSRMGVMLGVMLLVGCAAMQPQALLNALPTQVGTINLDQSRVIDDSFLSGFATDDVLQAMGKRRADATVVGRFSNSESASIGAMVVIGVAGDAVLDAFVQNWEAPGAVK